MTRPLPLPLRFAPVLLALGGAVPLAAQGSPGSFSLPQPTPTPTPAPAGPADERAGVAIPPRVATPAPRITPAPVLTDEATSSPAPQRPAARPQPAAPRPAATTASPTPRAAAPAPTAAPLPSPAATLGPTPAPSAAPLAPVTAAPALPLPSPPAAQPAPTTVDTPDDLPAPSALPAWWPWAAGAVAGLLALIGGLALWRRRKPKVLRLAATPQVLGADDEPLLPRIDISLDISGATRSVMMFTLRYRLTLANRSGRAVNALALGVQLACAKRGASNAAPVGAAQGVQTIDRIGPHQSRSISGEVQLPLAAITPVMQGQTPLFIPLFHVTLAGEGQEAIARSFVIGTPSGGEGRVQPIVLAGPPGGLPELRARAITPAPAAG